MNKRNFKYLLLLCGVFAAAAAADTTTSTVPEPFKGFDPNSKYVIDYTDLESLLDRVVLNTGRSTREKADPTHAKTGTRMKAKVNLNTINEGNRFYYEIFKGSDQNLQTLDNIRTRLESIPLSVPLEKFSRKEQLAYWLNLYNITVLSEVAGKYPSVDLRKMLTGRKSILSRELLNVAGVPLSLNDIQHIILRQNYDADPLVIYGLYQGNIGGPNIRKHAYTGKHVYTDLLDNALEFINSNRGTRAEDGDAFRVSSLYARNEAFFPDFDADLKDHLLDYLEGKELVALRSANTIDPDISDWTVTDLFGSQRQPAGSLADNSAALMGASPGASSSKFVGIKPSVGRYSPAVLQRLKELEQKQLETRSGTVTLEELGEATGEAAEDKADKKDQ